MHHPRGMRVKEFVCQLWESFGRNQPFAPILWSCERCRSAGDCTLLKSYSAAQSRAVKRSDNLVLKSWEPAERRPTR